MGFFVRGSGIFSWSDVNLVRFLEFLTKIADCSAKSATNISKLIPSEKEKGNNENDDKPRPNIVAVLYAIFLRLGKPRDAIFLAAK